jgi:hypothetical protein
MDREGYPGPGGKIAVLFCDIGCSSVLLMAFLLSARQLQIVAATWTEKGTPHLELGQDPLSVMYMWAIEEGSCSLFILNARPCRIELHKHLLPRQ